MTAPPAPLTETAERVARLEALAEHFEQSAAHRAKTEGFAASATYWAENAADLRSLLAERAVLTEERDRLAGALEPFAKVNWPSLVDAEDNEGDIPDSAIVEVEATDYCVTASDWYDDPDFILTVGDFRRARSALNPTKSEKSDG